MHDLPIYLCQALVRDAIALLDVQWVTGHLASLGASEISRADYLTRLDAALGGVETVWSRARRPGDWQLERTD